MIRKTKQKYHNGKVTPISIHFISRFILDRIFPALRPLFWPFQILTKGYCAIESTIWLMSNEYSKKKFASCGNGTRIYGKFLATGSHNIHIGNNVHINSNAFIRAEGGLRIDDNVHISRNLVLYTMNHNYQGECLPYDETKIFKPVHIKRNVWIGMNVSIAPGVTIGEGAIIGMGTVVARDIPALTIVGSAPVRELKKRDTEHYHRLDTSRNYGGMGGHPLHQDHAQPASQDKPKD